MFQTELAKSRKYALIGAVLIVFIIFALIIAAGLSRKSVSEPKEITRQDLILNLPHLTSDYSIVYSQDKDQIYINVLKPPYEENRQKALKWIRDQGVDPTKLNISYTPKNKFE